MSTQLITPAGGPTPIAPRPVRHRHLRTATAIAGVGALIAIGGYVATTTIGPDAVPPTSPAGPDVNPSAQILRDLRESVAGQYGAQAPGATINPSAQTLRALRDSVAGQYGAHVAAGTAMNPSVKTLREFRESVTGQYGGRATAGRTIHPSAKTLREVRERVAGQYGRAR
jgi:hypothetical protein